MMDCDSVMYDSPSFEKPFVLYLKSIGEGFVLGGKRGKKKVSRWTYMRPAGVAVLRSVVVK